MKNKRSPSYEQGQIDDVGLVRRQEEDAQEGHDQRDALLTLIEKAAKKGGEK